MANVLASAIANHDHERELVRQRERLAALNEINDLVRGVTDAVIEQPTRDEIERTVCEHLADSASYEFAWIGDADPASETVSLRAEAGVEGYLDGIEISVDPDDERSGGPTGRAFRTGEIQTTRDVTADDRHDPWRHHVERHGFRSSAAIPIVHEDTLYGVLNVYAARPDAFSGQERVVVEQLGEVVGHAIAATERKQALMSDELVELEFVAPGVFDTLGIDAAGDGRISLDHAVTVEDDEYLVYGRATPDAIDDVYALVDALPYWESVTVREPTDTVPFELRLSEPPILSVIASAGGTVDAAVVTDGDFQMTVHVPPSADVRRITQVVTETYPGARLLKQRQITRRNETVDSIRRVLREDLTDRQRTTVEVAYRAGFFEWPRTATGEDVAETLDIAPATFHQHLRKAQAKIVETVL
ncbi:GAF domain-containing protein [Halorientalis pallida]|uniref:GAF domain-containing protein n=1 Tax=Halorientalis pallida TaxID=2479928 RepID=A0A498L8F1_9EURY|nr:GAF domain-containing protein [Halorientalis pallida]